MPTEDLSGRSAGKFRLLQRVGAGGMGEVYRAEHETIGKRLAVKVLRPGLVSSPEHLQRFLNEARAAARIEHPGIINIFDCGTDEAVGTYLVMEYLDGASLAQRFASEPRIALDELSRIVSAVAEALHAAHDAGIVHRDLKPDNVFLVPGSNTNPDGRVVLLDFGVAKLLEPPAGTDRTASGSVFGTPLYMAPEQCESSRDVDHRADIYALGVLAYEGLCGRPPFVSEAFGELLQLQMTAPPPPPRTLRPELPPAMDEVLLRALAKRPEQRQASVIELASAFAAATGAADRAAAQASASALAPTMPQEATDQDQLAGGIPATKIPATVVQARTKRSSPPRRRTLLLAGAAAVVALGAIALWLGVLRQRAPVAIDQGNPAAAAPSQPDSAAAAAGNSCRARVVAFARYYDRVVVPFVLAKPPWGIELVKRPGTAPQRRSAQTVSVTSRDRVDAFYVSGSRVAAADPIKTFAGKFGELMEVYNTNQRMTGRPPVDRLIVQADTTATWRAVALAANAAKRAGIHTVGWAFEIPDPLPAAGPAKISPRLAALERKIEQLSADEREKKRMDEIYALWRDSSLLPCIDANKFSTLGAAEPSQRMRRFLVDSLRRCECKVDLASVKALVRYIWYQRPVGVVWRKLRGTCTRTVLSLAPETPWREAYRRVLATPEHQALSLELRGGPLPTGDP